MAEHDGIEAFQRRNNDKVIDIVVRNKQSIKDSFEAFKMKQSASWFSSQQGSRELVTKLEWETILSEGLSLDGEHLALPWHALQPMMAPDELWDQDGGRLEFNEWLDKFQVATANEPVASG